MSEVRVKRAKKQHAVTLWALGIAIAVFLVLSFVFDLPQPVVAASLIVIAVLALAMGITTMVVMVNKSPGSQPEE